jgi:hypothetical protein
VGLSVTKSTYLDQVIEIGKLASGVDGAKGGKEILATHRPKRFPPEVEEKMDKVLEGVLKGLNVDGLALANLPKGEDSIMDKEKDIA